MSDHVIFSDEALKKLSKGVEIITKAVKSTLGPAGKNVILDIDGKTNITKDGVSVAKAVKLEDYFENLGSKLIKEVSSNTADKAGDGTTTATVLAESIFKEGLRSVTAGSNAVQIQRGITQASKDVVEQLVRISKPISKIEEITQVATVSSNWDAEIAQIITKAMDSVGKDGTIALESSGGVNTTLKTTRGLQFERGYLSPHFANEVGICDMENPYVLVCNSKVSNMKQLVNVLEIVAKSGRPLLMVTEDLQGEALSMFTMNCMKGVINACAVKADGFGDSFQDSIRDISILTGATVVGGAGNKRLESVDKYAYFGSCKRVTVTETTTTIIGGNGDKVTRENHADILRAKIESNPTPALKQRLASFLGGVAVISVGASTEAELNEKKDRVEDALHATRAAVEQGILMGGGCALIQASKHCNSDKYSGDFKIGYDILLKAVKAPLRTIVENAGGEAGVVIDHITKNDDVGYNALTHEYGDLIKMGVVDPAKVTITALSNASSISGVLLTTNCIVRG